MLVSVKMPDDLVARIDAAAGAGKRGEWLRSAAEAVLGDGGALVSASPSPQRSPVGASAMVEQKRLVVTEQPAKPKTVLMTRGRGPKPPVQVDGEPQFTREDNAVVWRQLYGRRGSERMLADALGWMPGRVSKAVSSLLAAGQVRGIGEGFLEAVHPSEVS